MMKIQSNRVRYNGKSIFNLNDLQVRMDKHVERKIETEIYSFEDMLCCIPMFRKQIQSGGPLTVTDLNMTRFMMSIPKAVKLVLKSAEMAKGGEIFIFKMPALRIGDLAEALIQESAPKYGYVSNEIEIKNIGKRPGEKLYEELMIEEEAENAYEDEEMFIVLPQTFDITGKLSYNLSDNFKKSEKREYSSKNTKLLTMEEVKAIIKKGE